MRSDEGFAWPLSRSCRPASRLRTLHVEAYIHSSRSQATSKGRASMSITSELEAAERRLAAMINSRAAAR